MGSLAARAAAVAALREALDRAGYDEQGVDDLVRADGLQMAPGLAVLHLRSEGREPLGLLVRLFLAGDEIELGAAAGALAPAAVDDLEAAGLLERMPEGRVRSAVRLNPVRDLIVASDLRGSGPLRRDHVVYPGPAAATLAALTVRVPVPRALDLCCGSGVQALIAARHAERVVATDLNPRALRLAELSAALSGVENVEWREGDLFEPVADERFGCVVANPPFVISPSTDLTFRDAGRRGDELSQEVVAGCAAGLEEGGFGHVLCSWVRGRDEHYGDAPRRWLADAGCDVLVLQLETESPVSYAWRWNLPESTSEDDAVARTAAWQEYYERLGIQAIATGVVVFRRRAGSNWAHADELFSSGDDAGDHLARVFAGRDALLALADDEALLGTRLSLRETVRLIERRLPGGELQRARLSDPEGVRLPGGVVPPSASSALVALDGSRTLAEAGAAAGVAEDDLRAALASIRGLVGRGYIEVSP